MNSRSKSHVGFILACLGQLFWRGGRVRLCQINSGADLPRRFVLACYTGLSRVQPKTACTIQSLRCVHANKCTSLCYNNYVFTVSSSRGDIMMRMRIASLWQYITTCKEFCWFFYWCFNCWLLAAEKFDIFFDLSSAVVL